MLTPGKLNKFQGHLSTRTRLGFPKETKSNQSPSSGSHDYNSADVGSSQAMGGELGWIFADGDSLPPFSSINPIVHSTFTWDAVVNSK